MAATDDSPQPARSNREDETTVDLDLEDSLEPDDCGRTFGDYQLLELIARSGISVVYTAQSKKLSRVVSIEILRTYPAFKENEVELCLRGARAAAVLEHPHIVRIYDVDQHEGRPYFAMEYVTGTTLARIGGDALLPPMRVAQYVLKIAEAVDYAHQRGVLHLSLSPHKIVVDASDQPRVFGFESAPRNEPPFLFGSMCLVGNPRYMSPEQVGREPRQVGPPTDVYGLGLILYESLTGHRPYSAEGGPELIRQILQAEPLSPLRSNPKLPRDLESICLKCLEKEPARRYVTAGALAEDLGRFLNDTSIGPPVTWTRRARRWLRRRFGMRQRM